VPGSVESDLDAVVVGWTPITPRGGRFRGGLGGRSGDLLTAEGEGEYFRPADLFGSGGGERAPSVAAAVAARLRRERRVVPGYVEGRGGLLLLVVGDVDDVLLLLFL